MIAYILLISIAMARATSPPKIDLPEREPRFVCPHDESIAGLDMKKMLGKWQVAEISTTVPPEMRGTIKPIRAETLTFTENSDGYHLMQSVGKTQYTHDYKIVQEDRKIKQSTPNIINELKLAVVATDYNNVALVITCEQMYYYARIACVLLRNDSEDNEKYISQMNEKLPEYGFVVENMEKVDLS